MMVSDGTYGCVPLPSRVPPSQRSSTADQPSIKPDARQLVEDLPESATWDDLDHGIHVRQAVEAGVADADAGRLLEHSEALACIRSRIRRAS